MTSQAENTTGREITINLPSGDKISIEVEPNTTIGDLLPVIANRLYISSTDQVKILNEGKLLDPNNTIESYNLQASSDIRATIVLSA